MHTRLSFCATTNIASTERTSFMDLLTSHSLRFDLMDGERPSRYASSLFPTIPVVGRASNHSTVIYCWQEQIRRFCGMSLLLVPV
jgi:hypothetical protein